MITYYIINNLQKKLKIKNNIYKVKIFLKHKASITPPNKPIKEVWIIIINKILNNKIKIGILDKLKDKNRCKNHNIKVIMIL